MSGQFRPSNQFRSDSVEVGTRALILLALAPLLFCLEAVVAQTDAVEKARQLFSRGSNESAAQILETELRSHPGEVDAHLLLGQIYALEDRRAECIRELSRAIELRPDSATAYNVLGTALSRFAEFDAARKAFEQAVTLEPTLVDAQINLGMSLAQSSDLKGAAAHFTKAIQLRPNAPTAARSHYLLAKIYETQDSQRAINELEKASRIDPKDQQTWLRMGVLKSESGDPAGALVALQRAVACNPRDAESQYELGSEYLLEGDARQAVIHLERARQLMPKPTIALLYKLDRALRKSGDAAGAEQMRAQTQQLLAQSDEGNLHFQEAEELEHSGIELEQQGDVTRAVEKYRAALEMNPQQNRFRYNYGLALCRLGRYKEGISELNEVLENDPGNIDARRALFIAEDKAREAATKRPDDSKPE